LEDDAIPCNNFSEILTNYQETLPSDVDMAFLNNGCNFHAKNIVSDKVWYPVPSTRTCCSYIITRQACEKMLPNIIPFHNVIDFELNNQITNLSLKVYWCEPTIVRDGSEFRYSSSH
jgi:hypothetical protein